MRRHVASLSGEACGWGIVWQVCVTCLRLLVGRVVTAVPPVAAGRSRRLAGSGRRAENKVEENSSRVLTPRLTVCTIVLTGRRKRRPSQARER